MNQISEKQTVLVITKFALIAISSFGCFFILGAPPIEDIASAARYDVIVYEKPMKAKTLGGVVTINPGTDYPIAGAAVTITDEKYDKAVESTTTDEGGRFSFSDKKNGIYYLEIYKPGFDKLRMKVKIGNKKRFPEILTLKLNLS